MKKKTEKSKVFCIGKELVIINGNEITPIDLEAEGIDENVILAALDKQLQIRPIPEGAPAQIFRNAIEDITGISFCSRNFKYNGESIHDSEFYRQYLPYILESLKFKEKTQRDKERRECRIEYWRTQGTYQAYCMNRRKNFDAKEALQKKNGHKIK